MASALIIECSRCGRREPSRGYAGSFNLLPKGWEGSIHAAVCPGCQYAEWHPHCTSLCVEAGYGERLDVEALRLGGSVTVRIDGVPVVLRSLEDAHALPAGEIGRCDYIDTTVAMTGEPAAWPEEWTCPKCGGAVFEWVHCDYQASNLKGSSFATELEEEHDDG